MGPIILIVAILVILYCIYVNNETNKESVFEEYRDDGLDNKIKKTQPVEEHFENTLSNEDFVKKETTKVVKSSQSSQPSQAKTKRKYSKNTPRKKQNTIEKIVESK